MISLYIPLLPLLRYQRLKKQLIIMIHLAVLTKMKNWAQGVEVINGLNQQDSWVSKQINF